jgi:hypothetical protein
MSKHTRAPWKKGNDCIIAEIDRHVPTLIAITGNYGMGIPAIIPDDEEAEANERLMIAAPEMLEALEVIADRNRFNLPMTGHQLTTILSSMQQVARAAVAKAKGGNDE